MEEERAEPKTEQSLSEKENALLTRFKSEKEIGVKDLNPQEQGALGRLASRKLVEKVSIPTVEGSTKLKRLWKLVEGED